eukprot:6853609-Pyramimonas_sp.AAC.1
MEVASRTIRDLRRSTRSMPLARFTGPRRPPPDEGRHGASPTLRSLYDNQRGHVLHVTDIPTGVLSRCRACSTGGQEAEAGSPVRPGQSLH